MKISKNIQSEELRAGRGLHIAGIVFLLILMVGGALSIPFVYESQTLWYKIGIDRTLLRAGKIAGLFAAVLLLVQILLGVRGKALEKLFGAAALVRWHRANGLLILLMALCHVTLVLVPEGLANLPIGMKYWPEMVGAAMFCIICSTVILSLLRQKLGFHYGRWRVFHRLLGYSAFALVGLHILFVSDSFEYAVPRTALVTVVAAVFITVLRVKYEAYAKRRQNRK